MQFKQKIKYYLLFTLIASIFGACNSGGQKKEKDNQKPDEIDYMHKEVMRIHDEVMPRMKEISALQEEIKNTVDSLSDLENPPAQVIEELKMNKLGLDAAAASMMSWMKTYRTPQDDQTKEEAMQYLEQEKVKIKGIEEDFETQIEKNRAYLEQFN